MGNDDDSEEHCGDGADDWSGVGTMSILWHRKRSTPCLLGQCLLGK